MCIMSIAPIQADNNSWFAGWGTAFRNMSTRVFGGLAQSPVIKKNKEKIIAVPVVVGGTALGLWAGWYYWFKKPKVDKLKKELLSTEADFYNNQKLGTHLGSYRQTLQAERDALVAPPVFQMRVSLSEAAQEAYDRADNKAKADYARRLSQNPRAQELNNEIGEINQEIKYLDASQKISFAKMREYQYQLGYPSRYEPVLLKDTSVRKTLQESQAQSRKINKEKLDKLKAKIKQEAPVETKAEEWEEIPITVTR